MDYLSWPPFYTLQRAENTRRKQLKLWKDLVLGYHKERKLGVMNVKEFELFSNASIERELSAEAVAALTDELVKSGHGDWVDGSRTGCVSCGEILPSGQISYMIGSMIGA